MVRGDQIAVALVLRDRLEIGLPDVGEDVRGAAVVVPVDLAAAQQEDAAQNEFGDPVGMRLRVGESQRRPPGTAEDLPAVDAEMGTKPLHVGDEVGRGVHAQIRAVGDVRAGLSATALVEQHDPVLRGIEEASLGRRGPTAGTAVHEDHGLSLRVARGLPVDLLAVADIQVTGLVGLDLRVEVTHGRQRRRRSSVAVLRAGEHAATDLVGVLLGGRT